MILRLYLPKAEGLNKQWIQPPLKRVQRFVVQQGQKVK